MKESARMAPNIELKYRRNVNPWNKTEEFVEDRSITFEEKSTRIDLIPLYEYCSQNVDNKIRNTPLG